MPSLLLTRQVQLGRGWRVFSVCPRELRVFLCPNIRELLGILRCRVRQARSHESESRRTPWSLVCGVPEMHGLLLGCFPHHTCRYYCPAGSTSPMAFTCQQGQYSQAGAANCTPCPPGRYGAAPQLASAYCSGPCAAGRFGDQVGANSSGCAGACGAGCVVTKSFGYCKRLCGEMRSRYADQGMLMAQYSFRYNCPPGSISPTALPCPSGRFSAAGAANCTPCSPGQYSDTMVALSCLPCPAGRYGSDFAMVSSACSGLCNPGRYGGPIFEVSPNCTGECLSGYVCVCTVSLPASSLCPAPSIHPPP